ncbi:MAG: hypothetical protein U9P14_01625 [Gemmatimonadota bacterium]|nr:hypothetical protein [Gemmatimonadota bacterium]
MFGTTTKCPAHLCLSLLITLSFTFISVSFARGAENKTRPPADVQYREDYNADGRVSVADVIALLILGRGSPEDPGADYNGDGGYDIMDVIALLVNIISGDFTPPGPPAEPWRVVGPGGGGGMFSPTVNPHDDNNVLVRCDMTGSYVTFNGGSSWNMFNLRNATRDFEFDPTNAGTVYAASTGLYSSTDGGRMWRLVYPDPVQIERERMVGDHAEHWYETFDGLPGGEVSRFANKVRVDPSDSDHLWFSFSSPYASPPYILFVSHDRGASWSILAENIEGTVLGIFPGSWWGKGDEVLVITSTRAVLISESTGQEILLELPEASITAAAGGVGADSTAVLYAMSANGLYRSGDLASSWQSVKSGRIAVSELSTLAVSENHPEVIYLGIKPDADYSFGICKSSDSGLSWDWVYRANGSSVTTGNYTAGWLDRKYGPSWRGNPLDLGVSATNPDVCYATDYGSTYRTTNGGSYWEQVYSDLQGDGSATSRGLDVTGTYGVHFDPFDTTHIFLSTTDVGAFHSFNGGANWFQAIEGVPASWRNTCYWMVFDPEIEGRAWGAWSNCHDLPREKMFRSGDFDRYRGGVTITNDKCRNWRMSNSGLPSNTVCTHIILDPVSPPDSRTLYVCGFRRGIFKSTNGGASWAQCGPVPGGNRNYWRLALLPGGRLFLLVARDRQGSTRIDGGLYRSTDSGDSWTQVALPAGVIYPNDLVWDPANPARMYLCCWAWSDVPGRDENGGWLVEARGGGVLRSTDGGKTWERVFREDSYVYAAAIDPARPSTIYINTFDSAAFRSEDMGENWTRIRGYNFKWGYRPVPDPYNPGMLYLTTFGGGIHYGPAAGDPNDLEDIENFSLDWRWGNGVL